ncbi:MAG: glycosyltransferase family 9 protein [Crocinitomicaceae bacterium]
MAKHQPKKIVISRTDSIGDVVLTLPMAGLLKEQFPLCKIIFLGNRYTRPIIQCSKHVDEIWEWAEIERMDYNDQLKWLQLQEVDTFIHVFPRREIARLAKKAEIPMRIGTAHRLFHLLTVNKLVNFTRKRSDLHEAQLNLKLLTPLGMKGSYALKHLYEYVGFENIPPLKAVFSEQMDIHRTNVILHPKSQGSAIEWGVEKFMELAQSLDQQKFKIFITGTEKEAAAFRSVLPQQENVVDLSGKMSLEDLIAFISQADVLVAASTGPLHIAGVCGIHAIGLFSDKKPIHPGRWKPLGKQITILKSKKSEPDTQPLSIHLRDVIKAVETTV